MWQRGGRSFAVKQIGLGRSVSAPDFRRHRRAKSPPSTRARVRRGALVPPASNPIVLRHVIDRAGGAEARAARMRPGPGFCALSVREVGHAWAAASGGHRRNGRREPGERGKNRNQFPADCALAGCTATLGLGIAPFSSGTRSGFGRPGQNTTASPPSPGGGHAWRRPAPERPGGTGRKAPCGKRSQPTKADGMPRVGAGGRPAAPRPCGTAAAGSGRSARGWAVRGRSLGGTNIT